MAVANGHNSISFPAIGTGHLGFPKQEAAYIMLEAVADFAQTAQTKMDVYFVIFPSDRDTFQVVFCIFCQDFRILRNYHCNRYISVICGGGKHCCTSWKLLTRFVWQCCKCNSCHYCFVNFFLNNIFLITFSLKAFEGQMKSLQHKISNSSSRQGKTVKQCCSIRTLKNNTSAFLFSF